MLASSARKMMVMEGICNSILSPSHSRSRNRSTRVGLRRRHRDLPRREFLHDRRDPRQAGVHLGIHLPRHVRRGGQGTQVGITYVESMRELRGLLHINS